AADFNRDGRPDLAVATRTSIVVLLGRGDGTFQALAPFPASEAPFDSDPAEFNSNRLGAGDFNGDGRIDLACANDDEVSVFLGDGRGRFTLAGRVRLPDGSLAAALTVGDFDNDGRPDLATANRGTGDVSILRGRGDGTFS